MLSLEEWAITVYLSLFVINIQSVPGFYIFCFSQRLLNSNANYWLRFIVENDVSNELHITLLTAV